MIAGLDLSTKRIGYAHPDGTTSSIAAHAGPEDPGRRLHELMRTLEQRIKHHPPRPQLIAIEGYAIHAPGRLSLIRLGEIGGLVRCRLFELDIPYVELPPGSVKRYATGNGNARKEQMIDAAVDLGGRPANDDEADAFHLRSMARAAYGLEDDLLHRDPHRLDAIDSCGVVWPILPKAR